jgi:hypothetical protein
MAFNLLVAPKIPPGLTAQKIPDKPGQPFRATLLHLLFFFAYICFIVRLNTKH